jgi:hypothetical protein
MVLCRSIYVTLCRSLCFPRLYFSLKVHIMSKINGNILYKYVKQFGKDSFATDDTMLYCKIRKIYTSCWQLPIIRWRKYFKITLVVQCNDLSFTSLKYNFFVHIILHIFPILPPITSLPYSLQICNCIQILTLVIRYF